LTPVLAPALLGILGFGAIGPVAGKFPPQAEVASNTVERQGTLAALIQALIGNVAAGSAFAIAQSIAMGGAVPAVVSAICAALGVGVGAAAAGAGSDDEDQKEEGAARTGQNRCPECKRKSERYCKHS
jgi:hypothetical protein